MLAYGAYLAYVVLAPQVTLHYARYEYYYRYPTEPATTTRSAALVKYCLERVHYFITYLSIALDLGSVSTAGVGLLALLTWPMPLGLLAYHLYLIWAGMTTNESGKWADWRDEMYDGVVFLGDQKSRQEIHDMGLVREGEEPPTLWPVSGRQLLVRTADGQPPQKLSRRLEDAVQPGSWKRCWRLAEVENVYDLGFWDNLMEVLT
jgi:palmitoyltransferase